MPNSPGTSARPIRVALSNDYELALLGLAQMLARHPDKVQIVSLTTGTKVPNDPDVVLFDTFGRLPDDDRKLRTMLAENDATFIVYSWESYPEEAARRHGAAGYIHKGVGADELVAAIVAIHEGRETRAGDGAGEPQLTWPGQPFGLSEREAEMLTFIVRGLTNDEIARRAFLSVNTVKTHIRTAYRKIGVESRAQAVAWGYRNGFATTSDVGP